MEGSANEQSGMHPPNCTEIIAALPFCTRVIYFALVISWLLGLLTNIPQILIATSIGTTFHSYYIWTPFTASFYVESLLFLFIVIYNFHTFLPKLEQRISSPLLFIKYLLNGIIIQLLTLTVQTLLFDPTSNPTFNGVGGIWFSMLFKYCYYNPHSQIKLCCFNWKFKTMWYPYILLGVCIILSFRIPIEMVVGLLYGLIQVKVETLSIFPSNWLAVLARKINFDSMDCWIAYGNNGQIGDLSDRAAFQNISSFQGNSRVPRSSPENSLANDPFANKQGIRLGDY